MIDSRLASVSVHSVSLSIPLSDFEHLPRQLGCSLHRRANRLELAGERAGCELCFEADADGELARLISLSVRNDPQGRFMHDVAALVVAYEGDLEATLVWVPALDQPRLVIAHGVTSHPLLDERPHEPTGAAGLVEVSLPRVEQWLEVARQAWREYRALTGQIEPDHQ